MLPNVMVCPPNRESSLSFRQQWRWLICCAPGLAPAGVLLVAVADPRQIAQRLSWLIAVRSCAPIVRPVYPGAGLDAGLVVPALDVLSEFPCRICSTAARSGRPRRRRHPMRSVLSEFAKDGF